MSPTEPVSIRTFYRIVWTNPPTVEDVTAKPSRSRLMRPEYVKLQTGISVFRSLNQARRTATDRPPWLGKGYIAKLHIPEHAEVVVERTTLSRGHYTLWADPRDILLWIDDVVPVAGTGGST